MLRKNFEKKGKGDRVTEDIIRRRGRSEGNGDQLYGGNGALGR